MSREKVIERIESINVNVNVNSLPTPSSPPPPPPSSEHSLHIIIIPIDLPRPYLSVSFFVRGQKVLLAQNPVLLRPQLPALLLGSCLADLTKRGK
jgi:hypothetical protein